MHSKHFRYYTSHQVIILSDLVFIFVHVCINTLLTYISSTEYLLRLFSAAKNREALYSPWMYARTFFGLIDLLTILPWYIQLLLLATGVSQSQDTAKVFRVLRIFRLLQLEDFVPAFSKLDNVFRATKDIMKATGLMAMIVWVGCAALFFIFEQNNPNFRECDASVPLMSTKKGLGCFDFTTVVECNAYYGEGMCTQTAFQNMPQSLYYVAVFLGGEWGVVGECILCLFKSYEVIITIRPTYTALYFTHTHTLRFYRRWEVCLHVPMHCRYSTVQYSCRGAV